MQGGLFAVACLSGSSITVIAYAAGCIPYLCCVAAAAAAAAAAPTCFCARADRQLLPAFSTTAVVMSTPDFVSLLCYFPVCLRVCMCGQAGAHVQHAPGAL